MTLRYTYLVNMSALSHLQILQEIPTLLCPTFGATIGALFYVTLKILRCRRIFAAALPHIRKYFPDQLLWTDSLCINQQDIEEKSRQVGMMGRIFASARTVIVWLGGDPDNIADDLETMTVSMSEQKADGERRRNLLRQLSSMKWFYRACRAVGTEDT